ncbi:hypothetical protein K8R43_02360, partial [archaeon]|nr:hypothetical protein [archaeon]
MIQIKNNGYALVLEKEVTNERGEQTSIKIDEILPTRTLTPAEYSYRKQLVNMGFPFQFSHGTFEHVDVAYLDNQSGLKIGYMGKHIVNKPLMKKRKILENNQQRICTHFLQIPASIVNMSEDFMRDYINHQIAVGYDAINIIDREKYGKAQTLEEDITENIETIKERDRLPRILMDMDLEPEFFQEKIEALVDMDESLAYAFRCRSIFQNFQNYVLLKKYAKKLGWVAIG